MKKKPAIAAFQALAAVLLCLCVPGCGGPGLLDWGIARTFPTLQITFGSTEWLQGGGLILRNLQVLDKATGLPIARAKEIRVAMGLSSVVSSKIREVVVVEPYLWITPEFLSAVDQLSDREKTKTGPGRSWTVGSVRCDFGSFEIARLGHPSVGTVGRFAFGWQDFTNTGEAADNEHELVVWGVASTVLPDWNSHFLSLDLLRLRFSLRELLFSKTFRSLALQGGKFRADARVLGLLPAPESAKPAPAVETNASAAASPLLKPDSGFQLADLKVHDLLVELRSFGANIQLPGESGLAFTLNTEFKNVPLDGALNLLGSDTQEIELANIEILSPRDPLVRVLSLHSVFVYFTIEGLVQKKIQRLIVLSPTFYLSEDFFLFMKAMRAAFDSGGSEPAPNSEATAEAVPDSPPESGWMIEQFRAEFGRIVLGGEREGQIGLPLSFQTTAEDIRFDNLASLRLETALTVEPQDYAFPALQIELEKLRGDLRLSYPPNEARDNLVNELYLDQVRWRQFQVRDVWLAATFDATGVYANLGGGAYGGYLNAGLSFSFGAASRWIGWVAGTGVGLGPLTDVLFPQNLRLTGDADFTVEVDARSSLIDRVKGHLSSKTPGTLRITKIDQFLENLPDHWGSLKKSGAVAALETLRDFSYQSAEANFWFVENQGKLTLRLPGDRGSRNLDLFLHADESPDGLWKKPSTQSSLPQ